MGREKEKKRKKLKKESNRKIETKNKKLKIKMLGCCLGAKPKSGARQDLYDRDLEEKIGQESGEIQQDNELEKENKTKTNSEEKGVEVKKLDSPIPISHTKESWLGIGNLSNIPIGHTEFSWLTVN